jgi:thioredoxin 1
MAIEISESDFEGEVVQSKKPVLVYFHLPSCAKCATWNNVAEGLIKDTEGRVKWVKLNVANNHVKDHVNSPPSGSTQFTPFGR